MFGFGRGKKEGEDLEDSSFLAIGDWMDGCVCHSSRRG